MYYGKCLEGIYKKGIKYSIDKKINYYKAEISKMIFKFEIFARIIKMFSNNVLILDNFMWDDFNVSILKGSKNVL